MSMNTLIAETADTIPVALVERPAATPNGQRDPETTGSPTAHGRPEAEPTDASPVFAPPQEEDWQRRSREVVAVRRAEAAARLAERQRLARNEAPAGLLESRSRRLSLPLPSEMDDDRGGFAQHVAELARPGRADRAIAGGSGERD